jgi:hypothetical protein
MPEDFNKLMGIILLEGFEYGDIASQQFDNFPGRSGTQKRTGSFAADVGVSTLNKNVSNLTGLTVGAGFWANSTGANLIRLREGGNDQLFVVVESDRSISVRRGSSTGSIIGQTAAGLFVTSAWNYIELLTQMADSAALELWFNDDQKLNLTGVDTTNTSNQYASEIRLGGSFVDDVYIGDTNADRLGDVRVELRNVNAAGTYTEWTPSTGSNYQNVDESPGHDSDSTYNKSATVGQRDTYNMTSLAATSGLIKVVEPIAVMRKDDATLRQAALLLKAGSTLDVGSTETLGLTYAAYRKRYVINPDTGVAFTISEVNALEAGVKVIT